MLGDSRKRNVYEAFEDEATASKSPASATATANDETVSAILKSAPESKDPSSCSDGVSRIVISSSLPVNATDPFECLNDDVVKLILVLLSARDTETLRRVSKLWKAYSEHHHGGEALVRYFGHVGEKARVFSSPEEANLAFRRRLYHEESLRTGRATRAFKCSNAHVWDIKNDRLMWASSSSISIRNLKDRGSEPEIVSMDASTTLRPGGRFWQVCLSDAGDIVFAHDTINPETDERLSNGTHLVRVAQSGAVLLRFSGNQVKEKSSRVVWASAIHGSRLYTLEEISTSTTVTNAFIARDLTSGEVMCQRLVSPAVRGHMRYNAQFSSTTCFFVVSSGMWVIYSAPWWDFSYIFNTVSGEESAIRHPTTAHWLISTRDDRLCCTSYNHLVWGQAFFYTYDTETHTWIASIEKYYNRQAPGTSGDAFDPSRWIFFELQHRLLPERRQPLYDAHTSIIIGQGFRDSGSGGPASSDQGVNDPDKRTVITLPGRIPIRSKAGAAHATQSLERRALKIFIRRRNHMYDFFGMVDDYLFVFTPDNRTLVVVDFWPRW
ncbi:hypothetical protein MMC18_006771 [Xylographa bjoerkii]|nr:hypothetical protein [Xylographa bjoerkii]